jgi:riboflavin kinase/FMN adenylyltransferase
VLAPADGVYAVLARVLGDAGATTCMLGVANLGTRPTFAAGRSLEVHLLDFDGDLYGRRLRVGFVARLRGEQKFDGIDALGAQIRLDAAAARARLSREGTLDVLL